MSNKRRSHLLAHPVAQKKTQTFCFLFLSFFLFRRGVPWHLRARPRASAALPFPHLVPLRITQIAPHIFLPLRLLLRARLTGRWIAALARCQEVCFYNIPTEKESKAGAKPELLKRFPSGHEELVTKILLLDVDKVGKESPGMD